MNKTISECLYSETTTTISEPSALAPRGREDDLRVAGQKTAAPHGSHRPCSKAQSGSEAVRRYSLCNEGKGPKTSHNLEDLQINHQMFIV